MLAKVAAISATDTAWFFWILAVGALCALVLGAVGLILLYVACVVSPLVAVAGLVRQIRARGAGRSSRRP